MSLFSASESQLDRAEALYAAMHEDRLCPDEPISSHEALWGELRSLCERPLTGGEMWHEWHPLFDAFKEDQRDAMLHYMQERWTLPLTKFADLEQAFWFEVLRANIEMMRAHHLPVSKPALGEQGMQAWEQQAGVSVPEPLRTFVVNVSAGSSVEAVDSMFDFSPNHMPHKVFGHMLQQEQSEEEHDSPDAIDVLAGALELFDRSPSPIFGCAGVQAIAQVSSMTDVAHDAIILGWDMSGAHVSWVNLLIPCGGCSEIISFCEPYYLEERWCDVDETDFHDVRRSRVPVMKWARDRYYLCCLSEEVWSEFKVKLDYVDLDY